MASSPSSPHQTGPLTRHPTPSSTAHGSNGPIIEDITDNYSDSGYEADSDERLIYPSSYEDARSASPPIGTDDEDEDCLLLHGRAQGAHKAERREEVSAQGFQRRSEALQDPGSLAQVFQRLRCERGEREKVASTAAASKPQPQATSTAIASTAEKSAHVLGLHSRTASQGSMGVKRSHKEEGLTSSDEEVMADRADATPEHRRMKRRTESPKEWGEDFGPEPDLIGAMEVDTPAQMRGVGDW